MRKAFYFVIFIMLAANCAEIGKVEIGFNDDPNYTAAATGDLAIRVLEIEIGYGSEYTTIWEGSAVADVQIGSQDFFSITNDHVDVTPGSYNRVRVTVDSVSYTTETSVVPVLNTSTQFTASSFSDIEIGTTEMRLVVTIASANWFDSGSHSVIPGHSLFEGATFRESY
jgi:hypothetical protein